MESAVTSIVSQATTTQAPSTTSPPVLGNVEFLRALEPSEPFDDPVQIEVDDSGTRIYVTDSRNGRIVVFSSEGEELDTITAADRPFNFLLEGPAGGVDSDAGGNLFVAEAGTATIVKLRPDGTELDRFTSATPFGRLFTVTVDSERDLLYASDDFAHRYVIFDTQGVEQGAIGSSGAEPGQIKDQGDLAIAPDGTLWIADWGNSRIQHWNSDGTVIEVIGPFAEGVPGAMDRPNDIALDRSGRVWVADAGTNEVLVFSQGEFVTSFGGADELESPNDPSSLVFDAAGLLYVADYTEDRVLVFRPS